MSTVKFTVSMMNERSLHTPSASNICSFKFILYTFSALCIMMFGSVLIYMYHVNEIVDVSLKISNHVNEFYQKDAKLLLKALNFVNEDQVDSTISVHKKNVLDNVIKKTTQSPKTTKQSKPVKVLAQQKASESVRKDNCSVCFEHNFKYVIDNENICKKKEGDPPIELVVFIFTTHARKKQRDTIRHTWITSAKNNTAQNIRYAFLLGETKDKNLANEVMEENKKNHDIIKEDFTDAYSNLTYKTMMAYKYASTKCKDVKYVMKTDDDMYVNIPAVFNVIKTHGAALQTAVGGACHLSAQPIRSKNSKWYASIRSYPHSHYPGFCSGTGYVTSQNVAAKVFEISKHVPFFHLEDVYVALCIKKLGYKLKPIRGFNSGRVRPDSCTYKGKSMVTSHEVPPSMIEQLWKGKCNQKQ